MMITEKFTGRLKLLFVWLVEFCCWWCFCFVSVWFGLAGFVLFVCVCVCVCVCGWVGVGGGGLLPWPEATLPVLQLQMQTCPQFGFPVGLNNIYLKKNKVEKKN
jgi:hypothetical protein